MTNLKFDEVVEGEDILSAFDFGAESKQAEVSKPAEVSLAAAFGAKTAEKPVTISADQFSELMNMVKGLTEEVASLKAGKPVTKVTQGSNKVTQSSNATEAKPKRTREQYMSELKEKGKAVAAERFAKCISESGKTPAEVQAAFKVAHSFAAQDQTAYKARFDEKLVELIGVRKYAVAV